MCDALHGAKKIAGDTVTKLGAKEKATKDMVKRWFFDADSTDATLDEFIRKLKDGFKSISTSCGSTTLVFPDYLDWRKKRKKYFGGAIPGGEGGGFPIVCPEGAFTRLAGKMPRPKRVAPPEVTPVTIGDVRFEAVHWGGSRGLGQNGGFIAAVDPSSGRELWILKVYEITYDPAMEQDVQDVFIERIRAENGKLIVTDEDGRRYAVDVKRRLVVQR